ncbi:extracellular matrix protein 2 isoform X2 [Scleropages formosus]|uniref:extracellular matrix protein 2 isoform X2 n=1 Tax=Scleropages formosus TaxID=113540 RepID=UPI0008791DF3|nr:extracellular matrix protein 2 isoform X2 [Scleropages formosus]
MRPRVLLAVLLLIGLGLVLAQEARTPTHKARTGRGQLRRRGRKGSTRQRGADVPIRLKTLLLNDEDHTGASIFIDSYRTVQEMESSYNVLPGKKGACQYRGIAMFDKAVWSPKPCITCLCTSGKVVCDEFTCPRLHCPITIRLPGECCPVCTELVPNDPGEPDETEVGAPQSQEELDELLRKEEEDRREEEDRLKKKDEERRRRRKEKKLEVERQRKLLEEAERQEKEEEEKRKQEEEKVREEEERLQEEVEEVTAVEKERQQMEEEQRREDERRLMQEVEQRNLLRSLEEALESNSEDTEEKEEEEEVRLRGDVFEMLPEPSVEVQVLPVPAPHEEDTMRTGPSLPTGCVISDIAVICENAKLTSIPPLSIPELKELSLEGNAITTVPVGAFNGIPNLERINLGKNKLTSAGLAPQAFKNLKRLQRLYLDGNLLEQIPTDLPPSLEELKLNENKLHGIDEGILEDLTSLVTLELEGNMLSEGTVDPSAFHSLRQLSYLRLGRNHFRTIPQGLPPALLEIYLENNLIEEISETAFNQTTNLNIVVLRNNKLDESRIAPLAWINHRNLESIDLSHNKLYQVPSFLPRSLVHLVLVGNQIERIPGYVFAHMDPGIEYLYLSFNKLDNEGIDPVSFFGAFHSMIELFLDHNQLTSVPLGISEMRSLHFLRLNDNKISNFEEESICDPLKNEDSHLVMLRLENNFIDTRKMSPTAFSCIISYSSVVLKPQKIK